MSTSEEFFKKSLYPFQDGILDIVKGSGTPFYLTGGTALSRRWFSHRYSEDLDLFVDNDPGFPRHVDSLFTLLKEAEGRVRFSVDQGRVRRTPFHVQLWLLRGGEAPIDLKVDLVNDVAPRVGAIEIDPLLGRVDNWRNILANKVTALSRYEPKDLADIWILATKRSFSWREVVANAAMKEAGIDPVHLHEIVRSVPIRELERILWGFPVDLREVKSNLATIAEDLFLGRANSLAAGLPDQ